MDRCILYWTFVSHLVTPEMCFPLKQFSSNYGLQARCLARDPPPMWRVHAMPLLHFSPGLSTGALGAVAFARHKPAGILANIQDCLEHLSTQVGWKTKWHFRSTGQEGFSECSCLQWEDHCSKTTCGVLLTLCVHCELGGQLALPSGSCMWKTQYQKENRFD